MFNLLVLQSFGEIKPPEAISRFGDVEAGGIGNFLNVIFKLIVVLSGVYALLNLLVGGYGFMSAADDPKKVASAWARIWQTFLGLAFTAGAFVLAAIFGKLIFNDYSALLQIRIVTP